MKLFAPWQETINLLSGAKPRRTPRPGESFAVEEQPRRSTNASTWWMTVKEMKNGKSDISWGVSSCIDLYGCDLRLMQDEAAIKRFVCELCDLIKMRRYGETQVVRFGDDPRVTGFSMTQLIETSLVSAHFADNSRAIYLDVFSCAPYDPNAAAAFAARFFKAQHHKIHVITRQ